MYVDPIESMLRVFKKLRPGAKLRALPNSGVPKFQVEYQGKKRNFVHYSFGRTLDDVACSLLIDALEEVDRLNPRSGES